MTNLQFEWNPKTWVAYVVLSDSAFLLLEVEINFRWSVSAWTGLPGMEVEAASDCRFTTDCLGEASVCGSLEEAQECAENFVIRFRERLAKEADLRRKWLAQELVAIDRLRNILEERESNAQ